MSFLPVLGPILSGAGAIFGGLGVGKKSPDNAYNIALQEQSSLRHEKDSFNQKMELAKQHGLHPLSVLGVPTSTFSPAILSDSSGSADLGAIGYGANQISSAFVKPPEGQQPQAPTSEEERITQANLRIAEANANRAEWEALHSQWRTEDMLRGQPGNPPGVRVSNDVAVTRSLAAAQAGVSPGMFSGGGVQLEQKVTPPHPSLLGHSMGADQSFQRMVDKDGKLFSMPNPNVYQPDIEQFGTFHYLSNKYGVDKAMNIMAVLEQAPLAGGLFGTAAAGGYAAYKYFAKQRADALARRMNPRVIITDKPKAYKPSWRAGSRNE